MTTLKALRILRNAGFIAYVHDDGRFGSLIGGKTERHMLPIAWIREAAKAAQDGLDPERVIARSLLPVDIQERLAKAIHRHYSAFFPAVKLEDCRERVRVGKWDSRHHLAFFLGMTLSDGRDLLFGEK